MSCQLRSDTITVGTLGTPGVFGAGAGLTLDMALNYDTDAASTKELVELVHAAPEPSLPSWWHAMDSQLRHQQLDPPYQDLLRKSWPLVHQNDLDSGNYGWNHYGDFQIGPSYWERGKDGQPRATEDWGALQYDLAFGLLSTWMHTGDDRLWIRGQAAVRSAMDTQVAKFEPFAMKRCGAGLRKGPCPANVAHLCQEPIPEFNYHSRALLLYSHLTGERWPQEVAHMVIDNSAYFAFTRTEWTAKSDRPMAWALRNLFYGAMQFPNGTEHLNRPDGSWPTMHRGTSYRTILDGLLREYLTQLGTSGNRLLGTQAVWQGQLVEGLIMVLEAGLVDKEIQDSLKRAIVDSVRHVAAEDIRFVGGEYQMRYDRESAQWANFKTYGFFWLSSLRWVEKQGYPLKHSSEDIYRWLMTQYEKDGRPSTRTWTALMGFGSYFVHNR